MTAHVMRGDREDILRKGLDDYLAKPVSREELRSVLARWLGREPAATTVAGMASATAPASDDSSQARSLIDNPTIEELRGASGDALVAEVAELFAKECTKRLRTMREAAAAGDPGPVSANAHALMSSAASLGALALSRRCAKAERDVDGLVEAVEQIETLAIASVAELRALIDRWQSRGVAGSPTP